MNDQERCPTLAEIVMLLHSKGLCNWDYGTYEEMEKSDAECECYEYARPILELFGHDSAPSSVAEHPQPTKKPPYTASDKAVRIVLGTQPKFVVIEPEAHCSLITDDTLLIWAEQPSREQAKCKSCESPLDDKGICGYCGARPAESRKQAVEGLVEALQAIHIALQEPAGGEYWTARKYLDDRNVFNDDLSGMSVLNRVAEVALAHYEASRGGKQ